MLFPILVFLSQNYSKSYRFKFDRRSDSGVLHGWGGFRSPLQWTCSIARALATGEATVILEAFQHNSFASEPARE